MRLSLLAGAMSASLAMVGPASAGALLSPPVHSAAQVHPGYPLYATFGAAGSLIVHAWYIGYTEHRELTSEEAQAIVATSFFPPLALYYLAKHVDEPAPAAPVAPKKRHHH